jgi:hypothetical protein
VFDCARRIIYNSPCTQTMTDLITVFWSEDYTSD